MNHVIRSRMRRQALVTLKSGSSFSGVLHEWDRRALVLRSAQHLDGERGSAPVDGELLLLVSDVDFVQLT